MAKQTERIVNADRVEDLIAVFGSFDENIKRIEQALNVQVVNRGTDLLNSSLIHNNYCIRHGERLLLVMGNKHESDTHFLLDLLQLCLHLLTQSGIQSA